MSQFVTSFLAELEKIAADIKIKVPSVSSLHALGEGRDPGGGTVGTKMRIQGGAQNMGVVRPPTLSTSGGAASRAKAVRAAAGRRDPTAPAITPTV